MQWQYFVCEMHVLMKGRFIQHTAFHNSNHSEFHLVQINVFNPCGHWRVHLQLIQRKYNLLVLHSTNTRDVILDNCWNPMDDNRNSQPHVFDRKLSPKIIKVRQAASVSSTSHPPPPVSRSSSHSAREVKCHRRLRRQGCQSPTQRVRGNRCQGNSDLVARHLELCSQLSFLLLGSARRTHKHARTPNRT